MPDTSTQRKLSRSEIIREAVEYALAEEPLVDGAVNGNHVMFLAAAVLRFEMSKDNHTLLIAKAYDCLLLEINERQARAAQSH